MNKTYLEYSRYDVHAADGSFTGSHPRFEETMVHIMHMSQICSLAANYFNRYHNDVTGRGKDDPYFRGKEVEELLVDKDGYINAKRLFAATLLHDLGKEEVPIEILAATGTLTDEERKVMLDHTRKGERMLTALLSNTEDRPEFAELRQMISERYPFVTSLTDEDLEAARYIAKYHHETADASGYEKIKATPLLQLVGLADSYQATRMKRSYHDRNSLEATKQIILSRTGAVPREAGKRPPAFDADVAEAFFEDGLQTQIQKTFGPVYGYLTTAESINTDTMMAISSFIKDYPGQCKYVDGREVGYGSDTGFIMSGENVVAFISSGQLITAVGCRETIDGMSARINECYREACQREYGIVDAEFPSEDYEFMRYTTSKGRRSLKISKELSVDAGLGDTIDDARRNLTELGQIRQAARTAYMMGLNNMGDRLSTAEISLRELLMYRDTTDSQLNGPKASHSELKEEKLIKLREDIKSLAELSTSFIISVSESCYDEEDLEGRDIFKEVEEFVADSRAKEYAEAAKDLMMTDYEKAREDLGHYLSELSLRRGTTEMIESGPEPGEDREDEMAGYIEDGYGWLGAS